MILLYVYGSVSNTYTIIYFKFILVDILTNKIFIAITKLSKKKVEKL